MSIKFIICNSFTVRAQKIRNLYSNKVKPTHSMLIQS